MLDRGSAAIVVVRGGVLVAVLLVLDEALEELQGGNRRFVLLEIFGKANEEVVLVLHFPVLDHLAELGDAVVDQLFLVAVGVADDLPEKVGDLSLEGGVLGVLA